MKTVTFYGNGCKEEKHTSLITRIFYIRTTINKIELTGLVISKEINCNLKKLIF